MTEHAHRWQLPTVSLKQRHQGSGLRFGKQGGTEG